MNNLIEARLSIAKQMQLIKDTPDTDINDFYVKDVQDLLNMVKAKDELIKRLQKENYHLNDVFYLLNGPKDCKECLDVVMQGTGFDGDWMANKNIRLSFNHIQ